MTPQSSFMYLAPIAPARETELRQLLSSMNTAPGRVNANNSLIPFAEFDTLHFARVLILEDKTTADVRAHGLPVQTYPLYLAFLGDIDGEEEVFLQDLARRSSNGLRALFSCCEGFNATVDLADWLRQHRSPSIANYVNCRGRTVCQVREETALRDVIEGYLTNNEPSLQGLSPQELHAKLRGFITAEKSAGRLAYRKKVKHRRVVDS
jgi:hypothetical protein